MKTLGIEVYTHPLQIEDMDPQTISGIPEGMTVIGISCDGQRPATVECVTREDLVERWRNHCSYLLVKTPDGPVAGALRSIRRVWHGCQ